MYDCFIALLFFIALVFFILFIFRVISTFSLMICSIPLITGGDDKPLHVFLDERNFYYIASINDTPYGNNSLKKLKQYLKKHYRRNIIVHVVTKNTNMIDFSNELDEYNTRYDTSPNSTDILHIANTVYDTEKISYDKTTHHLRGRDDFLTILLAYEYLDKGEDILIISTDKFRDISQMYQMPEFNEITMANGQIINQRHINPSKFRFSSVLLKRIIDNPTIKISIDSILPSLI